MDYIVYFRSINNINFHLSFFFCELGVLFAYTFMLHVMVSENAIIER